MITSKQCHVAHWQIHESRRLSLLTLLTFIIFLVYNYKTEFYFRYYVLQIETPAVVCLYDLIDGCSNCYSLFVLYKFCSPEMYSLQFGHDERYSINVHDICLEHHIAMSLQ